MKKFVCIYLIPAILNLCCHTSFGQANQDSALISHSYKWGVKKNKGLFGLSKPDFGPYNTVGVGKFDSAVIKKKTRDSTYTGAEISGSGTDFDQSKFMTIEKTKFYKLSLATPTDKVDAVFAIASVSNEKRQTFVGKMMSKSDEVQECDATVAASSFNSRHQKNNSLGFPQLISLDS